MTTARCVDSTLSGFQSANYTPISGYQDAALVSLEQSVQPFINLIPSLSTSLLAARQQFTKSVLLSDDESAAIYLYSMGTDFFGLLNATLRKSDRNTLKPWFPYLKLLINGLEKLPSIQCCVWRGITENISLNAIEQDKYVTDQIVIWWSVNSCSSDLAVSEPFTGLSGTVFLIECEKGKDITSFSAFKNNEQEVVLLPGTQFRVKSSAFGGNNNHFLVHLKEHCSTQLEPKLPLPCEQSERSKITERLVSFLQNAATIKMKARWSKTSVIFTAEKPSQLWQALMSLSPNYMTKDKCPKNFKEIQINCTYDEAFKLIKVRLYRSDDKTIEQKEIIGYLNSTVEDYGTMCEILIETTLLYEHTPHIYTTGVAVELSKNYTWKLTYTIRPRS